MFKSKKSDQDKPKTPEERLASMIGGGSTDRHQTLLEKLDNLAFYVDMIKDGMTVKTGEYEALTRLFTGQKMYVDTRDTSFTPHIAFEGVWEREITDVWRTFVRPNDVVMDIGANFGYYGLIAATDLDMNSEAMVHFFEPNPYLTPLIEKSCLVNGLIKNFKVAQAAISDQPGEVQFNLLKNQWCSSSINDSKKLAEYTGIEYEVEETITAKVITIDQYCEQNNINEVGLMKLDVEGFEDKAFAGMKKTVANSPNLRMFLEFTIDAYDNPKAFFDELRGAFTSVQAIEHASGQLIQIDSFEDLEKVAHDRWAMLLLTKGI